jgi:hypothetical protein
MTGSIIHDMTVKALSTQYAQFDVALGMDIQGVEMLPAGSAMNATTHQGNIPFGQGTPLSF